jgi:hypothetical protein
MDPRFHNRRYNPSIPPVRPQRAVEGWMVAAVVLGLALGSAGLIVKFLIVPAFASATHVLQQTGAH